MIEEQIEKIISDLDSLEVGASMARLTDLEALANRARWDLEGWRRERDSKRARPLCEACFNGDSNGGHVVPSFNPNWPSCQCCKDSGIQGGDIPPARQSQRNAR